ADADGDSVVTYRFTDANAAAGSFYMAVGNTAYAQGATVDIAAANLSNFWVHGASSNKTDALTVQVYDGYGWSAPQNISIVTHGPNHVPVVSAATTSFGLNQTVAASDFQRFRCRRRRDDAVSDHRYGGGRLDAVAQWRGAGGEHAGHRVGGQPFAVVDPDF